MSRAEAQSLSGKRAQVEFHKFASLGDFERVIQDYAEENLRRRGILVKHRDFIGPLSPFLEIGANAGHTSYMLANDFGADGFALDLSADAPRYGAVLKDSWGLSRTPVRLAGDALHLPFRDGSIRMIAAFQMLHLFMDIESVFLEVKRVLAPGGGEPLPGASLRDLRSRAGLGGTAGEERGCAAGPLPFRMGRR
jgi:ubiquinone/menaquinone biosynthesis C-methylase UbiE